MPGRSLDMYLCLRTSFVIGLSRDDKFSAECLSRGRGYIEEGNRFERVYGKGIYAIKPAAERLYYDHAERVPILTSQPFAPKEICENKKYGSITELWLKADHYKWRTMRAAGIDEYYITGDAEDIEKFKMWAKAVERLPGSPLYHWAHLELKRYFDIHTADDSQKCG